MQKSPDAFRTISEVATDLDIPQHVLRFWETRFSTIRPLKRGGGRRYYRPDDVELLRGIRQLLYGQGYTIKGVQRILKQDGPRFVQAIGRGESGLVIASPSPADGEDDDEPADTSDDDAAPEPDLRSARAVPEPQYEAAEPVMVRANPGPLPASLRSGLSPTDTDRLRAALDELRECERILGTLREPD